MDVADISFSNPLVEYPAISYPSRYSMRRQLFFPILFLCTLLGGTASGQTNAARIKVAEIDGEPVYHWTHFHGDVRDDIDRALILREWRRGGYALPRHYVDEAINAAIKGRFGGDRVRLTEELARAHLTLGDFRKFTAENMKVDAMREYVTRKGKYGEAPIPEAEWLASLRKGVRIKFLKGP